MAFWDNVRKLFGGKPAPPPTARPAPPPPARPVSPAAVPAQTGLPIPPRPVAKKPPDDPGPQPSDFLPVGRDELLKQAEDVRRTTGWMWFGRRDMIPPASDPRTKLIDRGMLSQKLLSADDLAEMHRVGDEWSKFSNRLEHIRIHAGKSGDEAVAADREARAEAKAAKKAAAAEKRRRRMEAVENRRSTDIMFVGRGVSRLLHQRTSDEDLLRSAGLPVLHTAADLANVL